MTSAETRVHELIATIVATDPADEVRAWARLDELTKPPRSLGRLEQLAATMGRIQATDHPRVESKAILLMAGDHGVVAEGVSPYPQDVTWQMVANIAAGGAAINQLAATVDAAVVVHDIGVARDLTDFDGIVHANVAHGTANMAEGPAMTREECSRAILAGAEAALAAIDGGADLLGTGEMGIGNTTAASALTAVFCTAPVEAVVGRGTGLDDDGVARKAAVIERALLVNDVQRLDVLGAIAAVGGLEIAALTGVVLGAASRGVAVIADGFISGAAALSAVALAPLSKQYLLPSHLSMEPGHAIVLEHLGLEPVLSLDMRLGEGTGAALAMGIVDASCRMLSGMATFAEAGVEEAPQA